MNDDTRISILGCGWLGFPLAKRLLAKGWQVKGSTTTPQKIPLLQAAGIEAFLLQAEEKSNFPTSFFDSDILFINVPPSRKTGQTGYLNKMQNLLSGIKNTQVRKVIFISSTSVYGDVCREVTEADAVLPSELAKAETLFLSAKNLDTTVIRFGGLFGPDRNPGRFFKDKNSIPNGLSPVNLIHLEDCLGLIEAVLNQPKPGVYNAVSPSHPTRKEFYGKAISKSGFTVPKFMEEKTDWKIISTEKITTAFDYQFQYPDLLACLDAAAF